MFPLQKLLPRFVSGFQLGSGVKDIDFNVTRTIYCCQPLQARFPAVVAGAKSSGALPPMNSQAPPFEHPFKIRLERGTVLPLVWLALGSAALAEIAARSVPAAIVLDLQHGLWERGSLEAAAGVAGGGAAIGFARQHGLWERGSLEAAAGIAGVCPSVIARTADFSAPAVGAALDAGVAAVMAPLVESADDARVLAGASRYPPQGRRSGGGVRPLLAGADSMLAVNRHVAVGAMIETALGAQNAEAICAVAGIDFIFVGTGDLQLSMPAASPGQLKACCARIRDIAHRQGLPCGLFTSDAVAARQAFAEGYELAVVANDIGLAARGFADAVQAARS